MLCQVAIGMKALVKVVLGFDMEKNDLDKFSDWNVNTLSPDQIKYAVEDVCAPLSCYEELKKMPDLTLRLKEDDVTQGKVIDLVPRNGNVACMATRAATGRIVEIDTCQSPEGIVQKKVKAGNGMVAIQLTKIYSPGLKLPHYKKEGSLSPLTLADFGNGQVVVPVQMLKEHVASASVRVYPIDAIITGMMLPSNSSNTSQSEAEFIAAAAADTIEIDGVGDGSDELAEAIRKKDDEYPSEDDVYDAMAQLSSHNIEFQRASVLEGEEAATGRIPLQCDTLPDPPTPSEIQDVFSPLLGDIFHAMNRAYVPIKHEAKKGYFVALQNAVYVFDEVKMAELERRMEATGLSKDEIESMKYYNSRLFIECIDRKVPPPSILYWRIRAVYALYGNMKDGKSNKPLFNTQAWVKAKGVLKEILLGFYSDPPGISMYTKKLNKDGSVKKYKYKMELIECMRGTNRTEAYVHIETDSFARSLPLNHLPLLIIP